MNRAARPLLMLGIAIAVGIAAYLMLTEQECRNQSQTIFRQLTGVIDSGESLTPEQVHEQVGREPDATRNPGPHKLVEEYTWKSQLGEQKVYAYYRTGATQLLEAVSINQKLDSWEQP